VESKNRIITNVYTNQSEAFLLGKQKEGKNGLKTKGKKRRNFTNHARNLIEIAKNEEKTVEQEIIQEPDQKLIVENKTSAKKRNREDISETTETSTPKNYSNTKQAKRYTAKDKFKDELMMPEYLTEIPADLQTSWYVIPIPANSQRCLVMTTGVKTISRKPDGSFLKCFTSTLPCGYSARNTSGNDFCVLDCFYNQELSCHFVLDIMCWKGYAVYDCDSEFRFFFAQSKLQEVSVHIRNQNNPCPFIFLPRLEVTAQSLQNFCDGSWLTSYVRNTLQTEIPPITPSSLYFYNKEAIYFTGTTPLVCHLDISRVHETLAPLFMMQL